MKKKVRNREEEGVKKPKITYNLLFILSIFVILVIQIDYWTFIAKKSITTLFKVKNFIVDSMVYDSSFKSILTMLLVLFVMMNLSKRLFYLLIRIFIISILITFLTILLIYPVIHIVIFFNVLQKISVAVKIFIMMLAIWTAIYVGNYYER